MRERALLAGWGAFPPAQLQAQGRFARLHVQLAERMSLLARSSWSGQGGGPLFKAWRDSKVCLEGYRYLECAPASLVLGCWLG